MEAAAVESISKALGLPRPFLHEPNRAFAQLETWQQLTALLATQPVGIKPLGYYRTPDSVDMYVSFNRSLSRICSSSRRTTVRPTRRLQCSSHQPAAHKTTRLTSL
jgi:hypothetical protein